MPATTDGLISALENNFTTIDLALTDLTDEEFHRIWRRTATRWPGPCGTCRGSSIRSFTPV